MGDLSKAKDLAHRLTDLHKEADAFFPPHINDWLTIVRKTKPYWADKDFQQDFHFSGINDEGITFNSEEWEETWGYGGHETYPAQEITIPFDFFDNPQPFHDHANQVVAERDRNAQKSKKRAAQAMVKQLQFELKEAQKKAEGIK